MDPYPALQPMNKYSIAGRNNRTADSDSIGMIFLGEE
jgi:hypothetical protein